MLSAILLNVALIYHYAECRMLSVPLIYHYAECRYAECRGAHFPI